MEDAVWAARELLNEITPLKRDCGRVCGARCCASLDGEETGMLLFPGEEAVYRDRDGWTTQKTPRGTLLICPGTCDRDERPLACRLFPLLPLPGKDGVLRARVDLRAMAVCPLARQGRSAMDPQFTEAVRQAGELLAKEEKQRAFLETLQEEQEEIRRLRKEMGGGV